MRVRMCEQVCVIEANSLQLRVITIGLYQFLSRSPSCQILAVCGRRLRGVSGSWFPRFLSPAAFLDSDRRRLVCPLLPCATRLSPYGKLRFCLRKAPRLPTEAPPLCLRKAPFSFSLRITSCNKLSFSATESSRLHCDSYMLYNTNLQSNELCCFIYHVDQSTTECEDAFRLFCSYLTVSFYLFHQLFTFFVFLRKCQHRFFFSIC